MLLKGSGLFGLGPQSPSSVKTSALELKLELDSGSNTRPRSIFEFRGKIYRDPVQLFVHPRWRPALPALPMLPERPEPSSARAAAEAAAGNEGSGYWFCEKRGIEIYDFLMEKKTRKTKKKE